MCFINNPYIYIHILVEVVYPYLNNMDVPYSFNTKFYSQLDIGSEIRKPNIKQKLIYFHFAEKVNI